MATRLPGQKLSEAESKAQKRALDCIAEDCKRICTTNLSRPFATLQDAIDQLLPFHMLGALAGDEADAEEEEALAAAMEAAAAATTGAAEPGGGGGGGGGGGTDPSGQGATASAAGGSDAGGCVRLLCSRRELAAELAARRAVDLQARADDLRTRLLRLDGRYRQRATRPLPEEELFIAQVLKEVAERSLEAERQRPQHQDSSSDSSDDDSDDGGQQRQGQGQQAGR